MAQERKAEVLRRFGLRLRQARQARGLSQEQLGLECGLSQTYLSEVESGKRNISLVNLDALAMALQITLSELMDEV